MPRRREEASAPKTHADGASLACRAVFVAVGAVAAVIALAVPASAHTIAVPTPTNYRSTVERVTPAVPGLSVRVTDLGNKLVLTNRTDANVDVLGYEGELYLRVGPSGVFENLRSPATYLNRTRLGTTPVPSIALHTTAATAPLWRRVSNDHTAIWHDHRIHWMGRSPPPVVQAAPDEYHVIDPQWTVTLRDATRTIFVQGRLDWVPGPSGRAWIPVIGALFLVGALVTACRRRASSAAALGLLVGIDGLRRVSAEVARPGTQATKIVQFFGDNFVSVIVWVIAALTIWGLCRRRHEATYGVMLCGSIIGAATGLVELSALWKSQLPGIEPALMIRAEIAAACALGLGLGLGALVAIRRDEHANAAPRRAGPPLERLVHDLDSPAVERLCDRLNAHELIPILLADLAEGRDTLPQAPHDGSVVFVVLARDAIGAHVWSMTPDPTRAGATRITSGRLEPIRTEIRTTLPTLLQLAARTRAFSAAVASDAVQVIGDAHVLKMLDSQPGHEALDPMTVTA